MLVLCLLKWENGKGVYGFPEIFFALPLWRNLLKNIWLHELGNVFSNVNKR